MSPAAKPMKVARRSTEERVPGFPRRSGAVTPEPESDDIPAAAEPAAEDSATTAAAPVPDRPPAPAPSQANGRAAQAREARDAEAEERPAPAPGADATKPGGHRHQTNFRLYESEMAYLKRLRREFEDDEIKTDMTELVHAVIYATRRGELDPLEILRRWRKDLNDF